MRKPSLGEGRRSLVSTLFVLLVVGVFVGCGGDDDNGGDEASASGDAEPYKVGAAFAMTGDYAGTDRDTAAGLEATINEINDMGGVDGHPLEFKIEDGQSEPARTALAAQKIVDEYEPDVMIPDIPCLVALSALPVANRAGLVTFTGCDSGDDPLPSDPENFPNNYSTFPPSAVLGLPMAAGAAEVAGTDDVKIGFLHSDDTAGQDLVEPVQGAAEAQGHEFVGAQAFAVGEPDLTVQMSQLRDAGANVVALWGQVGDGGNAVDAIRDLDWDVVIFGGTATVSDAIADEIPQGYEDNFRALVTGNSIREGGRDSLDPWISEYLEPVSDEVQTLSVVGAVHDGLHLWKWAAERAGSIEPDAIRGELEQLSELDQSELPDLQLVDNPRYSSDQHGELNANLDEAWGIMRPSQNIMGTYEGEPFTCECTISE